MAAPSRGPPLWGRGGAMRAKVLIGLVGALLAAVALASASGAATAKAQKVTRIDVSTRAAVIHYLRSIHVNPKGAVIQRGGLNYAGARCPGARWTCASTKHTVVQIAKRGGQNRFACRERPLRRCPDLGRFGWRLHLWPSARVDGCVYQGRRWWEYGCLREDRLGGDDRLRPVLHNQPVRQRPEYGGCLREHSEGIGAGSVCAVHRVDHATVDRVNNNTACVTQMISLDGSTTNTNGKADDGGPAGASSRS